MKRAFFPSPFIVIALIAWTDPGIPEQNKVSNQIGRKAQQGGVVRVIVIDDAPPKDGANPAVPCIHARIGSKHQPHGSHDFLLDSAPNHCGRYGHFTEPQLSILQLARALDCKGRIYTKELAMKKPWFLPVATAILVSSQGIGIAQQAMAPKVSPKTWQQLQEKGVARVIVELNIPWQPEAQLGATDRAAQRNAIAAGQKSLLAELAGTKYKVLMEAKATPTIGLEVDFAALLVLEHSAHVKRVNADVQLKPFLSESVPLIEGTDAWSAGYDGTGQTIVIVGSGVAADHSFLEGKIVAEACYSVTLRCPNGQDEQVGTGAATTCIEFEDCLHETPVAGIAVGEGATFSGVAKGAKIIAIQVFGDNWGPSILDVIRALRRAYDWRNDFTIAAVNLSSGLAGEPYSDQNLCDQHFSGTKFEIDNLRAAGIATVIASGNEKRTDALSPPACISTAVSVGASTKTDTIWNESPPSTQGSNTASYLSLLAPGANITSSIPGPPFFFPGSGTSLAAPHVAGAWAILKQRYPTATVAQVLAALQLTALPIKDTRDSDPQKQYVQCRIRIKKALDNFPTDNFIILANFSPDGGSLNYSGISKCQLTGNVRDSTPPYNTHGFVLNGIGGEFISFDPPNSMEPQARGINNTGHIAGYANIPPGSGPTIRGFVRFPNGTFDFPINPPVSPGGTVLITINDPGQAVGWWTEVQPPPDPNITHGLLKPLGGPIQTIDRPGATETQFYGINNLGQMVGQYVDSGSFAHGFLRLADGTYQDINCPGAVRTNPFGINDAGYIVGRYITGSSGHAFIRSPDGTCTIISPPNVVGAQPNAINNFGQVIGSSEAYGFVYNSLSQ